MQMAMTSRTTVASRLICWCSCYARSQQPYRPPPPLVRRTLRISCEGRTTLPWITVTGTDHDAPARLQPPLVCCIRLFYSAARFPTTLLPAVPRTRPDRTPNSLQGARQRDPGGCGTARVTEPAKPARLRRPETWPAATCCPLGRHGTARGTRAQ
jgi:hypothetical protein